jgi:hypothetical protein
MIGEEIELGMAQDTMLKLSYDGKVMALFSKLISA